MWSARVVSNVTSSTFSRGRCARAAHTAPRIAATKRTAGPRIFLTDKPRFSSPVPPLVKRAAGLDGGRSVCYKRAHSEERGRARPGPRLCPMTKFIDVTVPLSADLPTFPGDPPFELDATHRMGTGDAYNVCRLALGT